MELIACDIKREWQFLEDAIVEILLDEHRILTDRLPPNAVYKKAKISPINKEA